MRRDSVKFKEINALVLAIQDGFDRDKVVGVSPLESSSFTVLSSGSKDFRNPNGTHDPWSINSSLDCHCERRRHGAKARYCSNGISHSGIRTSV